MLNIYIPKYINTFYDIIKMHFTNWNTSNFLLWTDGKSKIQLRSKHLKCFFFCLPLWASKFVDRHKTQQQQNANKNLNKKYSEKMHYNSVNEFYNESSFAYKSFN